MLKVDVVAAGRSRVRARHDCARQERIFRLKHADTLLGACDRSRVGIGSVETLNILVAAECVPPEGQGRFEVRPARLAKRLLVRLAFGMQPVMHASGTATIGANTAQPFCAQKGKT
jgi:hypothetical protein